MSSVDIVSVAGKPLPSVTWWRDLTLLDSTDEVRLLFSERVLKLFLKFFNNKKLFFAFFCQVNFDLEGDF